MTDIAHTPMGDAPADLFPFPGTQASTTPPRPEPAEQPDETHDEPPAEEPAEGGPAEEEPETAG